MHSLVETLLFCMCTCLLYRKLQLQHINSDCHFSVSCTLGYHSHGNNSYSHYTLFYWKHFRRIGNSSTALSAGGNGSPSQNVLSTDENAGEAQSAVVNEDNAAVNNSSPLNREESGVLCVMNQNAIHIQGGEYTPLTARQISANQVPSTGSVTIIIIAGMCTKEYESLLKS